MSRVQSILFGISLGLGIPFLLVGIVNIVLVLSTKYLTTDIFQTTLLLGVGINALFIKFFSKKKKDSISRGFMISSLFIVLYWVIRFVITEK